MSVALTYASTVTVAEVLTGNAVAAATNAAKTVTHTGYNSTASLTSSTTPPVTVCAFFSKALSTGTATIDLTALTGTNGATVDGTGLKVQVAKFKNPTGNANSITVTFGASNPYLLGGSAFKWILSPGQEIVCYGNDATPDVASGAKTIDLSGTGSQALECSIVMG